jgi:short subunit dehydrogenase-like uncharacterized protein
MTARIVVFGATGYTGRLTAEALVARGVRPVLAARDPVKLGKLAEELGGDLETQMADVDRPESVASLVEEGDVLVATVGPFARWGDAAANAAIARRAHYLDSTGEPPFIRKVFEHYGPSAKAAGIGMLTAFGYDWVPGNLAAGLALREAGPTAVRVDTGYYNSGPARPSGGTSASLAGVAAEPAFAFRDGALRDVRSADRYRTFTVRGRERPAVTVGSSEHFTLPRLQPGLRDVNSYLGWFGPMSRAVQVGSLVGAGMFRIPGSRKLYGRAVERWVKGSTGGPDAATRAKIGSHVMAEAFDAAGQRLAQVTVTGVDGYTFTAGILAWGAQQAAAGGLRDVGALGPVDGFGLDELEAGCREVGIAPTTATATG